MKCSVTVLLLLSQVVAVAEAGAVLKLKFYSYKNPTEEDWDDDCCDLFCAGKCDHEFYICIDQTAGSNNNKFEGKQYCRINYYKASHYDNKNNIYFDENMHGVHNPTMDTIAKWEGSVRLKIMVEDYDPGSDDLVDKLYKTLSATPFRSEAEARYIRPGNDVIRGSRRKDKTSLLMDFTVYCEKDYYNTDCATHCKARDDNGGHYTCDPDTGEKICREGWESPEDDCTIIKDDCLLSECANGATCVDGRRSYTCLCAEGYTGQHCEEDIDECASNPCVNGGTCTDQVAGFTCQCTEQWLGDNCTLHVCEDDPFRCKNGGTCYGNRQCLCPPQYVGDNCSLDPCDFAGCKNGATCVSGECHCPPGFIGGDCSINPCHFLACENGATCQAGVCKCVLGWSGRHCHLQVLECESDPCQHEGTCEDMLDSYQCRCLPGYSGVNCELIVHTQLNDTIEDTDRVVDEDVTAQPVVESVKDESSQAVPSWALPLLILLAVLALIIVLIAVLLMKYRRKLRKAKQEQTLAAEAASSPSTGHFANPLYRPQHINNNLQRQHQNSSQGAVGCGTADPTYAAPAAITTKFPPLPLNLTPQAQSNHYDNLPGATKMAAESPYDTPPPAKGVFSGVLDDDTPPPTKGVSPSELDNDQQAPPLPEKPTLP